MANINYGPSDAQLANAGAQAYATNIAGSVDQMRKAYQDKVNELASGIVSGMTPQERAVLEKQVQSLGNQYSQALQSTEGQFAFAKQQAETTAAEVDKQYAAMQEAQRALASQAVGAVTPQYLPGMQTATQEDAVRQAQATGQANLSYLGQAQGIGALARNLYSQSLEAQRAATRAQLEGSRANLQTALEARALQSAVDREQKQRDELRQFELSGFNAVLARKAEIDNKIAELRAAAAAADTRTGKDKALAELDFYQKKANIDLAADLKKIAASAKSSGMGAVSAAVQDVQAEVAGRQSPFGKLLETAIANMPQGRPTGTTFQLDGKKYTIEQLASMGKLPRMYGVSGQPGIFYMSGNQLVHEQKLDGSKTQTYSLDNLNVVLNRASGYIQQNKLSGAQATTFMAGVLANQLQPQEKIALRYLFGTDDPANLAFILRPSAKSSTTKPPVVKTPAPQTKISYGGFTTPTKTSGTTKK
jgi:hypothetical protein